MAKAAKKRWCPAVGRDLSASDCGGNRNHRYACPADCQHNPMAPANYSALLAIEDRLDRKALRWLARDAADRETSELGLRQSAQARSPLAQHTFFAWHLFGCRDAAGRTCAERWEQAGFPDLDNDERMLLQSKMRMRVVLLEVRRVLGPQSTEAVDLLAPGIAPFTVVDRSLAAQAVRFETYLGWAYPMPLFWRLSGITIILPELGSFEPAEIVTELVRHLGGPTAEPDLRRWLMEYLPRFNTALEATAIARRQRMFANIDAQFGKAMYELQAPPDQCRAVLDAAPDLAEAALAPAERREGFSEARVWFAAAADPRFTLPAGGRQLLGQVLLGQTHWRLEAMGAAHLAQMRQHFERLLGRKMRFVGERRDDVGAQLVLKDPKFDASLVPPRLLESVESFIIASSQVPAPDPKTSPEDLTRDLCRDQDRAFLDDTVPALDSRTPREAARDPVLRLKLIRLLKSRVRQRDEENLRTGRSDDINWMLRELGIHEILFDPPPRRSPPPDQPGEDEAVGTDDPLEQALFRPLPKEPLTEEEARERWTAVMAAFDTAALAMKVLKASGSNLLECSRDMAGDFFTNAEYSILMTFEIQAWFALVPPGSPAPPLDGKALAAAFQRELRQMPHLGPDPHSQSVLFGRLLEQSRQPGLLKVLATALLNTARKQPAHTRPQPIASLWMLLQLKALLDALDRSVRDPA